MDAEKLAKNAIAGLTLILKRVIIEIVWFRRDEICIYILWWVGWH